MIDFKEIYKALLDRYNAGETQQGIADNVGMSQSYIADLLSGKRPVEGLTLKKTNQLFPEAVIILYGDTTINAPHNAGNVVGINNGDVKSSTGDKPFVDIIDKIIADEDLSAEEKIKFIKVVKK